MGRVLELLRKEPRARLFFVALTQSQLGTGAGYVALLLIAYDRYRSPWAVSLVLLADLLPAMVLGPLFGAVADRWSRRTCAVVADVLRAVAFSGIAFVDSFEATLALALVAGVGTGLFTPAALAGLPSLVERQRLPVANSIYGVTADLGFTVGPALAGAALLIASPEEVTVVNGATFLVSAVLLSRLDFGAIEPEANAAAPRSRFGLLRDAREGLSTVGKMPGIRLVIAASTGALFFGGLFNVGELPFADGELDLGGPGYAFLVAIFGLGFIGGSFSGAGGGPVLTLRRRFLVGIVLNGAGMVAAGFAPNLPVAAIAFAAIGFGNGMFLVHERLIL
jgi:MFS family permease